MFTVLPKRVGKDGLTKKGGTNGYATMAPAIKGRTTNVWATKKGETMNWSTTTASET